MSWWNSLLNRVRLAARDDRGSTTEYVIWIAGLATLALTVVQIFGPDIIAAAKNVTFTGGR